MVCLVCVRPQVRTKQNLRANDCLGLISLSLQTGKPWMIESDEFIESIEPWCKDDLAIENDHLLGALVTLRLIASTAITLLVPRRRRNRKLPQSEMRPLLAILNRQLEAWEATWVPKATIAASPGEESCHPFLIQFYGLHFRLQLYSLPLQESLSSPGREEYGLEILWMAYSSASRMLQLTSQFSNHLSFSQDSVHVMTAYSAALLVKVS
jgi:hypothetical protein